MEILVLPRYLWHGER